jgi:hypothetical protein
MSGKSRAEFARFIAQHNAENPEDKIPFITSHSGMNGLEGFEKLKIKPYSCDSKVKNPFYGQSINVSAEEAIAINASGGIMGLILDKGRLSSSSLLKSVEKISDPNQRKQLYLKMIWDNLFFFVESVGEKSAWHNLTIGTDFDGVISHIDHYQDMSTLPELKNDLTVYLTNHPTYKKEIRYGFEPDELVHKVFTQNAMDFLRTHFN